MSSEKRYISFYVDSHNKVLPRLLNEIKILEYCKREDINIVKATGNDEVEEELIFEDAGIKFKMSQLLQILRGPVRIDDTIPDKTEIIYKKDDIYIRLELIFDEEILGNILYYEIRINDVFDILDNAGMEIKEFVQKQMDEYRENGSLSE